MGALVGGVAGWLGGKSKGEEQKRKAIRKAKAQAARGFQKDWKAKKKRQVAAERGARAKVEQSNLMANMQQQFSDDQVLSSAMSESPTPSRGKGQFERFEQTYFG